MTFFGNQEKYKKDFLELNSNRMAESLCKMRGAALKLGQVLSIQESSLISEEVKRAFEKARQHANVMP